MWRHTLPVVSGPSPEKQEGPHTVDRGSSGGRVKEPGERAGVLDNGYNLCTVRGTDLARRSDAPGQQQQPAARSRIDARAGHCSRGSREPGRARILLIDWMIDRGGARALRLGGAATGCAMDNKWCRADFRPGASVPREEEKERRRRWATAGERARPGTSDPSQRGLIISSCFNQSAPISNNNNALELRKNHEVFFRLLLKTAEQAMTTCRRRRARELHRLTLPPASRGANGTTQRRMTDHVTPSG